MLTAGDVIQALGWLYIGIAAISVGLAITLANGAKRKASWALLVLGLFLIWPAISVIQLKRDASAQTAKLRAAKERFEMRCRSSGEKVARTVDNVEGILLMNARPKKSHTGGQFVLDDPYGRNCVGEEDCIGIYLFDYKMVRSEAGSGLVPSTPRIYTYVDVDDASGQRVRYMKESPRAPLRKALPTPPAPSYGVMWEDISTREDREHWIAGGTLKVIDLTTNEVIAERKGYLLDSGQGDIRGERSPWDWARTYSTSCPPVAEHNQAFVSRVLKPKKGGN